MLLEGVLLEGVLLEGVLRGYINCIVVLIGVLIYSPTGSPKVCCGLCKLNRRRRLSGDSCTRLARVKAMRFLGSNASNLSLPTAPTTPLVVASPPFTVVLVVLAVVVVAMSAPSGFSCPM